MSDINVNDLATLSPSALDGDYYGIVFTPNGDTNKVVLEDAVAQANSNNGCVCIEEAYLAISSADVLQLNSTPLTIVPAQGAGTAIEVISASVKMVYNSAAYATNTDLQLMASGGSINLARDTGVLFSTSDKIRSFALTEGDIIENTALVVTTRTGNPTTGDSDITVYVTYRVTTL